MDQEHALRALFEEDTPAARTLGDYLRDFSEENLADLNRFLSRMSLSLLHTLEQKMPEQHKPGKMCLDIDSTDHPQSGNKIEGVAWNYKNNWCL